LKKPRPRLKSGVKNKFEDRIFQTLKKKKLKFKYESAKISYLITGHYTPDFVITTSDGSLIYVETKGYLRPDAKRKMAAVKKLHPAIDLRILFYAHKEKDIKWADKIGLKWAVSELPDEWLDEFRA
jgi:restriction endonuclease